MNDILELTAHIRDFRFTKAEMLSTEAKEYLTNEIIKSFNEIAKTPLLTDNEIRDCLRKNVIREMNNIVYEVLHEPEMEEKLKNHYKKALLKAIKKAGE